MPSSTPGDTVGFTLDNWEFLTLPTELIDGLSRPYVAFVNQNDRDDSGAEALTPQPATGVQTLYFSPPDNRAFRIPIIDMPASTGDQVFLAAAGNAVAYFVEPGSTSVAPGLYLLDIPGGYSQRALPMTSLVQRGFYNEPAWAPDGSRVAVVLATEYATDVFTIGREGANPENLTASGSYDFWPTYSPDGRYLAFVSDRLTCPTWVPNLPDTCDNTGTPPPIGGQLYVLDLTTDELRMMSDVELSDPPTWINPTQIAFASGNPAFGDAERKLYLADVNTGRLRVVEPPAAGQPFMLAEAWSPDGRRVLYQSAGEVTEIVLADISGEIVGRVAELTYPRFGMSASWAPSGDQVAVGGLNGQCPFGSTVLDLDFSFVARSNPPPSMCAPIYSPDGANIAFSGVNINRLDGRFDVYVSNPNGFASVNLTGDLRGQMQLLGWVGPS